jgi:hypothetical protein
MILCSLNFSLLSVVLLSLAIRALQKEEDPPEWQAPGEELKGVSKSKSSQVDSKKNQEPRHSTWCSAHSPSISTSKAGEGGVETGLGESEAGGSLTKGYIWRKMILFFLSSIRTVNGDALID